MKKADIEPLQTLFISVVFCLHEDCKASQHFAFIGQEFPTDRLLPSEQAQEFIDRHYAATGHKKLSLHNEEKTVIIYTHYPSLE